MIGVPFAIIRTSVLFGLGINVKQNFFLWLYNNLRQGKEVNIVTDQYNTPTLVEDLSNGILKLIQRSAYGLFNISGKEYINRFEFANSLADVFGYDKKLINPITTTSLKQKANRPMNGGLKNDKAINDIDYNPQPINEVFFYLKNRLQDQPGL
jgi:dTDP-4-dehydrorhamnose reductase